MSKIAEQAANEIYKDGIEIYKDGIKFVCLRDRNGNLIIHPEIMVGILRNACQRGYEQAEKDLALTWEDIGKIHAHLEDVFKETAKGLHDEWTVMDMYEEVSKRFNEQRKK